MTDPGFIFGQVPTAAQWNAAFAAKQDTLGFTPVNRAGDTMTGKLNTPASTASIAGFAILPGAAPSIPVNGDIWLTGSGMFARVNGSSVQLVAGSGVVNSGNALQLAWYAANGAAISGNPNFTVFNGALTCGVQGSGITGSIILAGLISGGVTLAGANAGGSGTITFPAGTVDFSATGGTSQVVTQGTAGGIFTVRRLALSDLSNSATGTGAVVLASSPTIATPNFTGLVSINQNATTPPASPGAGLNLTGADAVVTGYSTDVFGINANTVLRRANGSAAAPSKLLSTNSIGVFGWRGWDNSGVYSTNQASINVVAAEDWNGVTNRGTNLIFSVTPVGSGTNTQAMEVLASGGVYVGPIANVTDPSIGAIIANASIKSQGTIGGVGYATGAGGTIGQITNKSTGVVLNAMSGAVTMNNAALGSGAIVSFVFTNAAIAATDLLILNHISGGTIGAYTINGRATGAGTASIDVRNNTGGSLAEAIVIQFAVIKGVNS